MRAVPTPKVLPGQKVQAYNYRGKGKWEYGQCTHAEYSISWHKRQGSITEPDAGHWLYTIILDRQTPIKKDYFGRDTGGNFIRLYVSDDHVEAA